MKRPKLSDYPKTDLMYTPIGHEYDYKRYAQALDRFINYLSYNNTHPNVILDDDGNAV